MALGADVRFPSGREEDLLGTGKYAGRFLLIGSYENGKLAAHVNAGAGIGGVTDEYFWSGATTVAPWPRVTIVGELIGRRQTELSKLKDVYEPYPGLAQFETMRWVPIERGIDTTFVVIGGKMNIARSWLLKASALIRLTDNGLRRASRQRSRLTSTSSDETRSGQPLCDAPVPAVERAPSLRVVTDPPRGKPSRRRVRWGCSRSASRRGRSSCS